MSRPSDTTKRDGLLPADSLRAALEWWDAAGVEVPSVRPPKARKARLTRNQSSSKPQNSRLADQISSDQISSGQTSAGPTSASQAPARKASEAISDDIEQIILRAQAAAKAAPTLDALKAAIETFEAADLTANTTNAVFARGNAQANIMVIGEAPGAIEDRQGKPFIGEAGQLLDKMLGAIGLDEQGVYITNVCNWRPIKARTPSAAQMAVCKPFIMRHIALAKPKHVLLVGGAALETLTGVRGMMKARGNWHTLSVESRDIPAMPIYHPAFLLKQPELKREAWHDLLTFKAKAVDS